MNRRLIALAWLLLLPLTSCQVGERGQEGRRVSGDSHLGTWQLVSRKYGNQQEFSDFPQDRRRIKHITPTHYTWVEFDATTNKVDSGAGGSYTLTGETYTESKDFALGGMMHYLGKKHVFTIRVQGDRLSQSGTLSDGFKIEEVWHRLK